MALTTNQLVVGMFNMAAGGYKTLVGDYMTAHGATATADTLLAASGLNPQFMGTNLLSNTDFASGLIGRVLTGLSSSIQSSIATIVSNYMTANPTLSRGAVVVAVLEAVLAVPTTDATLGTAVSSFTSKVALADASTSTSTDFTVLSQIVGGTGSTVTPGQSFVLTTGIDTVAGTSGNDTIIGDFGVTSQVSAADQINGGAGTDTFELYGTFGTLPTTITNVETLSLSGYGENKSVNVASLTGVTDLVLRNQTTAGTGDTTVTLAAGQTLTLTTVQDSANAGNELIVAAASTVTANTIKLDKAGDAATGGVDLEIEIAGTAVATLNLVTQNNASRISLQDETSTGDFAVATINITGDKNLTVDALAASSASKVTIAAGTFTGALDLNLSATEVFEVTGGTGSDRFNFGGALTATDKVAGGEGTDTLATSTAAVDATLAGVIDGKTSGVANNSGIDILEYTGTAAYAIDGAQIQMSTLKTYSTSGAIVAAASNVGVAVTNQANAQSFIIAGNVTGGAGSSGGSAGSDAINFAPAVNNGSNVLNLTLKGVTVTGGAATGSGNLNGGDALDVANFETINIVSTGATATAVNTLTGGALSGSGANGATMLVSANTTINISGANEINLGTISNSNQPVTIDASTLTGKLTVTTGTAADVLKGGTNVNTITLTGGADTVNLAASTAKADVITVSANTNATIAGHVAITGFTNAASTGDKLDISVTAALVNDASAVSAGTGLTASIASGIMTFAGANAATATLADKVAGAVKAGLVDAANEVAAFEHGGNTYIISNAGADNTFTEGTDILVELTGVTGLTALSITASAANTAYIV